VTVTWTQNSASNWTATLTSPDNTNGASGTPTVIGSAVVEFGSANNGVPDGTIGAFGATTGNVTTSTYAANTEATIKMTANFGSGSQAINLNLGDFGSSSGVTQFAGTTYDQVSATQDGLPAGAFSTVTTDANGNIIANYDNGQQRTIAQIPVITFAAPDALQRVNGQAFTSDQASGPANTQSANTNSAGQLVVSSVESSNVDIATEFSKLIIAQQAYGANTKVITAANQLLQETINMQQ
jgi:flagellar hook protein FlgE